MRVSVKAETGSVLGLSLIACLLLKSESGQKLEHSQARGSFLSGLKVSHSHPELQISLGGPDSLCERGVEL